MIKKCADAITKWLINSEAIGEEDRELYQYGVYSILLTLFPLLLAAGFGVCMGCVGQSIVLILPFVLIRKFSGGYHARHSWICLTSSSLLLLLCVLLSFQIRQGRLLTAITLCAAVSLFCFSPIDNENRVLNRSEKLLYKKVTAVIVIALLLTDAVLSICRKYDYAVCVSIGIILSAGLQLPCIFTKWRNHQKKTKNT